MSGMDLLLQAAGCHSMGNSNGSSIMSTIGTSNSKNRVIDRPTASASAASLLGLHGLHRSKNVNFMSRSCSQGSLPPKKRIRRSYASVEVMDGRSALLQGLLQQQQMKRNESFQLQSDTSLSTLGMSAASVAGAGGSARALLNANSNSSSSRFKNISNYTSMASSSLSNSEWTASDMSKNTRPREVSNSARTINFLELCKAGLVLPTKRVPQRSNGNSLIHQSSMFRKIDTTLKQQSQSPPSHPSSSVVSVSPCTTKSSSMSMNKNNIMMPKCRSVSDASSSEVSSTSSSTSSTMASFQLVTKQNKAKKHKDSPLEVKDLNGNDMGMGYFSSMS